MSHFKIWARRDAGYDLRVSLRFHTQEGQGMLSFSNRARNDSPVVNAHEEPDLELDTLRAGRFVHVLDGGTRRQAYSLSRLNAERLTRLPESEWILLEALTEAGFRYVVIPDSALESVSQAVKLALPVAAMETNIGEERPRAPRPAPVASVAPAKSSPEAPKVAGVAMPAGVLPPRPAPVASVSKTPALGSDGLIPSDEPRSRGPAEATRPVGLDAARSGARVARSFGEEGPSGDLSSSRPPPDPRLGTSIPPEGPARPDPRLGSLPPGPSPYGGPVTAEPAARKNPAIPASLAESAYATLTREQAIALLQSEAERNRGLLQENELLQRKLDASRAREADLVALLKSWQERG